MAVVHEESSWTKGRTRVLCIGRWIIVHCTTREVLVSVGFFFFMFDHFFFLLHSTYK